MPKTQAPKNPKKRDPKSKPTNGAVMAKDLAMASNSGAAVPVAKPRMPASFADLDPTLAELGLRWGAAKAHVVLRRRREGGPNPG